MSQQRAPGGPKIECGSGDDDDDGVGLACQERESDVGDVGLHCTSCGGPDGTDIYFSFNINLLL